MRPCHPTSLITFSAVLLIGIPDTLAETAHGAGLRSPHSAAGLSARAPQRSEIRRSSAATPRWRGIRLQPRTSVRRALGPRTLTEWFIRPIDGDTFAYGGERIRLQGVNAPELADSGGFEAAQRLDSLLREGPVRIVPKAVDVYGRTVAEVFVENANVATTLKREGYGR